MSIRLEYSVTAKCRPEHVWQKFQAIEQWAWWNPAIAKSRWLEGERWQKGGRFIMELLRPRRMTFRPVVIESSPPTTIAWRGQGWGVTGEHWFSFEAQPDATTQMRTWEDFSGWGCIFLTKKLKADTVRMYAQWLETLKGEAERIAREEFARG